MSDAVSVFSSIFSFDELLTPQFLCPVCGVIICAVIVFCIGVGFRSSSEPKFENAGEGDGVPFIKKKKKLKTNSAVVPITKKVPAPPPTKSSKKRQDTNPEKFTLDLKRDLKEKDAYEPAAVVSPDEWITPVTRKEKKARRRQEVTPEKESETLPISSPPQETPDSGKRLTPSETSKSVEQSITSSQKSATERKGRSGKAESSPKTTTTPVETKPIEKSPVVTDEDSKGKKTSKQKQKVQDEMPQERASSPPTTKTVSGAPTVSPTTSTRSKKKKGAAPEVSSTSGGFPLAEFELPSPVVMPAPAIQRKTPSPPSTDSSFELVDADAVREAIEAEHQEPSKTSGASRRKTKKPTKETLPPKVEEEMPVKSEPLPSSTAVASKSSPPEAPSSNINFDELGGSIDDWQDAKPSRKRRRARRDD